MKGKCIKGREDRAPSTMLCAPSSQYNAVAVFAGSGMKQRLVDAASEVQSQRSHNHVIPNQCSQIAVEIWGRQWLVVCIKMAIHVTKKWTSCVTLASTIIIFFQKRNSHQVAFSAFLAISYMGSVFSIVKSESSTIQVNFLPNRDVICNIS